MDHMEL
jgi:hypothetical protein